MIELFPEELGFRFDRWCSKHCVVHERNGPEWLLDCPVCGRPKLAVHVTRKKFRCFVCPLASTHPIRLVSLVLGVSWRDARSIVAQDASGIETGPIVSTLDSGPAGPRHDRDLPTGTFPRLGELGLMQRAYCDWRGFPREHLTWLGVAAVMSDGSGSKSDRCLSTRLLFPCYNSVGRAVMWAARSIKHDDQVKVFNMPKSCREPDHSPGCTCMHRDWGLHEVPYAATAEEAVVGYHLLQPGEPAIIVEGPTDVAMCGPGFVATLGSKMSVAQALAIARSGVSEAILLYDGDDAGEKARVHGLDLLSRYLPTRVATCPPGMDPGKLGRVRALSIVNSAPPVGGVQGLSTVAKKSSIYYDRGPKPLIDHLKR